MKMMLLIAFLLQSFFEDHQVANFQPLSTESSYDININITRLLSEEVICVESEKSKCDFHIFSELEKRNGSLVVAVTHFYNFTVH